LKEAAAGLPSAATFRARRERSRSVPGRLLRGLEVAEALFERYILCGGRKIPYLRRLGVRIGPGCQIVTRVRDFGSEPWLIEIGARVNIAEGVVFVNHDGPSRNFRDRLPGSSYYGNGFAPIRIQDNCFIGLNSVLMPGITIGEGSIVGAMSLVNRDVPPGTVVAGVPARARGTVDAYVERYRARMIPNLPSTRAELRRELTRRFFGEER
jgi:acetyltransferase-like isoleucine patch superfamily enzyme